MQDNNEPSVVIMTGNSLRHRYCANQLSKELNVLGIVSEEKRILPIDDTQEDQEIIRQHFSERDIKEAKYFANNDNFALPHGKLMSVPYGGSNSQETFEWVTGLSPNFVILYGTSIIKDPLLSFYDNRMINMHLGLSPYYRGSGTNFWPLVNREPECVGATIHLAVLKVDAGSILGQVRPNPEVTDKAHDLGCKTIIAGTKLMIECIRQYHAGKIEPTPQPPGGKLYRGKDFNADAVRKMLENFETGMMEEYIQDKESRDGRYPIIGR